ncbi:MAG: ATP-binding cassette domain-containing protein [Spirochaetota bacterium]
MVSAKQPRALVETRDLSYRVLLREILPPVSMTVRPGECWVVTGPNGSGKSLLTEILAGQRSPTSGTLRWPSFADPTENAAVVSFEALERIMTAERHNDESSVMHGRLDPGRSVGAYLEEATGKAGAHRVDEVARRLGIKRLSDRGLRFLSTGEFRKTLLAAALARDPALLVLDEPYDGLDLASRAELMRIVEGLRTPDRAVVVVANRRRDVPACTSHELELGRGEVRYCGPLRIRSPGLRARPRRGPEVADRLASFATHASTGNDDACEPIVAMHEVSLSYGETPVLDRIDWEVRRNERWMISGPNGSGKSTLLSLITGDNPKAYGQRIELFGRPKGSGESVWEIKRRIGIVSGDLQLAYPLRTTVEETVLSGFHDSIGLYERPGGYEEERARWWISALGLAGWEARRLRELSFGMRRMLLVARAVVKGPDLLIADEPCQGLDDDHARQVLELLDSIGRGDGTCMLYVTHDPEERLRCITHTLELVPQPGGSRALTQTVDVDRRDR